MSGTGTLLAADIEVGHHRTAEFLGLTFNIDTVWSTCAAALIVFGVGLYMARRASSGRPSKLQLAWETIVDAIERQVASSMGQVAPFVVPLALTLFLFILIANWLGLIPTRGYLEAPSADINFTLALALTVIVWMHITAIRKKGVRSYLRHYAEPYAALIPLEIIGEIVKPFTLALRLFGNIFAGGVMLAIIGLIPAWLLWLPNGLWKGFDLIIGAIQAFIFALLTILYFGFALEETEH
ncbi:MAG: F-type H+-transporting ATPase subunit a [Actinomycetota bacterium]|jgi:F-type H+-transporting ATPase subunit a|nr:F-type H+-transporting ATPase subunit a [Actinomycetota bacterium]